MAYRGVGASGPNITSNTGGRRKKRSSGSFGDTSRMSPDRRAYRMSYSRGYRLKNPWRNVPEALREAFDATGQAPPTAHPSDESRQSWIPRERELLLDPAIRYELLRRRNPAESRRSGGRLKASGR